MDGVLTTPDMAEEGRALLTHREREILAGGADVSDNYRYKVESIVRTRIRKHLRDDVEFLDEHFPEAADRIREDLRDVVCDG